MKKLKLLKIIASSLIVALIISLNPLGASATETIANSVETTTEATTVTVEKSHFKISNSGRINRYTGTDTDVVVPSTVDGIPVDSIGSRAFGSNVTSVNILRGVQMQSIKSEAFYNCTSLESIRISDMVYKIGYRAFFNCNKLASIYIPQSVKSIGIDTFQECSNLKSITVANDNFEYDSYDGVLFNKSKTQIIKYPEGKDNASYVIPNSVTEIADNAFYKCNNNLVAITIPNSVTSIGKYAFEQSLNVIFYVSSEKTKNLLIDCGIDKNRIILK